MLFGIDVASVDENKNTNWQLAKAQGPISFAIIRSNQSTKVDPQFGKTWPQLKATGIVRGAYMFLNFPNKGKSKPAEPDVQAQTLVDTVGELEPKDLPPTLDVEFPGGRLQTGMTPSQALDWVRAAWTVLRDAYDAPPMIYTSARVWREDLEDEPAPDLVESPLWLARYFWKERTPAKRDAAAFANGQRTPPVPVPWGTAWAVHQYQGDAVQHPGFSSTVDMNRFNSLLRGSSGDAVKWAQRRLGIATSGKFDNAMFDAVVAFQRSHGLVDDGIIGPRTFAALCWE
jgi:GH25 family lysozyme M1 (1,4-beta-N-acetylmuramidase)